MLGLGNSVLKFVPVFSLTDVSGLQLWLKNNIGLTVATGVSQWLDLSGNNNHVTQSTGGYQPALSDGGVDFDGSDDRMGLTSAIDLGTFHIFIVLSMDGTSNETLLGIASGTTDFYRFGQGSSSGQRFRANNNTVNTTTDSAIDADVKILFELVRKEGDTNNLITIVNGDTLSIDSSDTDAHKYDIGNIGSMQSNTTPYDGKVYEIAIYSGNPGTIDLANIRKDINTRNGL